MPSQPPMFRIDLQPVGRRAEVAAGDTLLAAAQAAGIELVAVCGGGGSCGTCRVRLISGQLSPVNANERREIDSEDLASGFRLACQATPLSDVRIHIPPESLTTPQRTQVEGQEELAPALDPIVVPVDVALDVPRLDDLRADLSRLRATLSDAGHTAVSVDLPVLASLSTRLRAQGWSARVALRRGGAAPHVAAVLPTQSDLLGLAVDLGTTKLAAYLVALAGGATLARRGAMNPQIAFGEDVIARIGYANDHPDGREVLRQRLVDALNALVGELCAEAGVAREQIVEAVVVGNTAMHHLFAGLPVEQLGTAPYLAAVGDPLDVRAHDIGLAIAPGACVYLPPNIAGYVGADHVAMLLAAGLDRTAETVVAIDIGTNTEVSLAHRGQLRSCSCASGPAFEGAHIRNGMRAAPGAIERVQITGDEVRIHTIGGRAPVGICGSGILDAIAQMYAAGILNERGTLQAGGDPERVRIEAGEFVLVPAARTGHGRDIVVTRRDVNEIQLAKGAIRAGIETLMAKAQMTCAAIDRFVIAGAFGTYLDVDSALRVGMFPRVARARFRQVGNAAGVGARRLLVSAQARHDAEELRRRIEYVELTTDMAFAGRFMDSMHFD